MVFFESVWYLLILIGVMIVIHELGHYWAARLFDVKIEAFSFGFGPRLFGIKRGETDWKVCLIPMGGYVKMAGELPGEEGSDDPRNFLNKPRWQRMIIAFAGPFMNIVLAIGIVTALLMNHHERDATYDQPAKVGFVAPDSPAAKGGLQAGDLIVKAGDTENPKWNDVEMAMLASINGDLALQVEREGKVRVLHITPTMNEKTGPVIGWERETRVLIDEPRFDAAAQGLQSGDEFVSLNGVPVTSRGLITKMVRESEGKPMEIVYLRKGEKRTVTVTPSFRKTEDSPKGRYVIGVGMLTPTVPVKLGFGEAFGESIRQNREFAGLLYNTIHGMLTTRISAKELSGPIGIAREARRTAKLGAAYFVNLMAMVSLNLAVFNLLPIPILDGGVILLLLVEMIFRRDLSLNAKEMIFRLGFAFLMFLVVFVFYNDIAKLMRG